MIPETRLDIMCGPFLRNSTSFALEVFYECFRVSPTCPTPLLSCITTPRFTQYLSLFCPLVLQVQKESRIHFVTDFSTCQSKMLHSEDKVEWIDHWFFCDVSTLLALFSSPEFRDMKNAVIGNNKQKANLIVLGAVPRYVCCQSLFCYSY